MNYSEWNYKRLLHYPISVPLLKERISGAKSLYNESKADRIFRKFGMKETENLNLPKFTKFAGSNLLEIKKKTKISHQI